MLTILDIECVWMISAGSFFVSVMFQCFIQPLVSGKQIYEGIHDKPGL